MKPISPQTLNQSLTSDSPPELLDVLTEQQYQAQNLPKAINACVYEIDFIESATEIVPDKRREVVAYGLSDEYEPRHFAYEKLEAGGWTNVSILSGGLEAWKQADLPVLGNGQPSPAPDGAFAVDVEKSVVRWVGRNLVNQHDGTVGLSEATIELDRGRLVGGKAVIDMSSIHCRDIEDHSLAKVLIDHLRTGDFFLVDSYPTATFELGAAKPIDAAAPGSPNYRIEGTLNLRGRSAKLEFPALLGFSDTTIALQAHFDFDRVQWGSKYGSGRVFEALGQHLVNDLISISFQLAAPLKS